MRLEFGLQTDPVWNDHVPYAWGGRLIYRPYSKFCVLDLPYDRQSFVGDVELSRKDDFGKYIDEEILCKKSKILQQANTKRGKFEFGPDNRFICEYDDRDSGGYLYVACYPKTEI